MHKSYLDTLFIGQNIIHLPTCQSTNQFALELTAQKDIPEGTTVITSHQTAGKGQRGNTWEAEAFQNLTFSVILIPRFLQAMEQFNLNMAICLAIFNFLKKYIPEGLKIKWPNDLIYKDKKICGILIENTLRKTTIEKSVVGIGVNINQEKFSVPRAISLQMITGKNYDLDNLLAELLKSLEEQYLLLQNDAMELIKTRYIANLFQYGKTHTYKSDILFEGKIMDVDSFGHLILEVDTAQKKFAFKEISFMY